MTRAEVIPILKELEAYFMDLIESNPAFLDKEQAEKDLEAIRYGRNSLEVDEQYQLEYEQVPEPCEDCISREQAFKCFTWTNTKEDVYYGIKALPPVTPKPMQVELEGDGYSDGELVYDYGKCPKCGWEFEYGDKDWEEPYCCHCGQRLKY